MEPDNKVLAVGRASNGTDNDFAFVRYLPDGTVDVEESKNIGRGRLWRRPDSVPWW